MNLQFQNTCNALNLIRQINALILTQKDALVMPSCAKVPNLAPLCPKILAGAFSLQHLLPLGCTVYCKSLYFHMFLFPNFVIENIFAEI